LLDVKAIREIAAQGGGEGSEVSLELPDAFVAEVIGRAYMPC